MRNVQIENRISGCWLFPVGHVIKHQHTPVDRWNPGPISIFYLMQPNRCRYRPLHLFFYYRQQTKITTTTRRRPIAVELNFREEQMLAPGYLLNFPDDVLSQGYNLGFRQSQEGTVGDKNNRNNRKASRSFGKPNHRLRNRSALLSIPIDIEQPNIQPPNLEFLQQFSSSRARVINGFPVIKSGCKLFRSLRCLAPYQANQWPANNKKESGHKQVAKIQRSC